MHIHDEDCVYAIINNGIGSVFDGQCLANQSQILVPV